MKRYEDPTITIAMFDVVNDDIDEVAGDSGTAQHAAVMELYNKGDGVPAKNIAVTSWSSIVEN